LDTEYKHLYYSNIERSIAMIEIEDFMLLYLNASEEVRHQIAEILSSSEEKSSFQEEDSHTDS